MDRWRSELETRFQQFSLFSPAEKFFLLVSWTKVISAWSDHMFSIRLNHWVMSDVYSVTLTRSLDVMDQKTIWTSLESNQIPRLICMLFWVSLKTGDVRSSFKTRSSYFQKLTNPCLFGLIWVNTTELLTSHLGRVPSRVTSHEGRVKVESRVTEISARVESSHESQGSRVESSRVTQSCRRLRHIAIACVHGVIITTPCYVIITPCLRLTETGPDA